MQKSFLLALTVVVSSAASSLAYAKYKATDTTCYGGMTGWSRSQGTAAPVMNIIYEPPPVNSTGLYVNADVGFYCDMFFEPDGPCSFCMKMFVDVSWVDSTNTIPWQSIGANEIVVNCWDFVGPPTDKWEELFETFPICQGKASEIQEKPAIVTITVGAFPKGAGPCPNDPYENHDALYRYAGTEWVDKFFRDFNMEGFWDTW